jgi:hypothetical protein
MAHLRIQHTLQGGSALPEDRFVNVFHVRTEATVTEGDLTTCAEAIAAFYDATPTGSAFAMAHLYNTQITATRSIKTYDMADAMPRHAIHELYPSLSAFDSSSDNLPEELAVCLSYHGNPSPGTPIARCRGRIYLGPWVVGAMAQETGTGNCKVADTLRDILLHAGKDLADALEAIGWQWCVWSPTSNVLHTITAVSVDNAWDIQRRRGHKPTFRTPLAI